MNCHRTSDVLCCISAVRIWQPRTRWGVPVSERVPVRSQEANHSERRCVCCFVSETAQLPWDGRTRQQGKRRNPWWAKSCLFCSYLRDWLGRGAQNQRGTKIRCQIISWRQFISHLGFIRAFTDRRCQVADGPNDQCWEEHEGVAKICRDLMISCTSAQLENMISVIPSAPRQNRRPVPNSHDWFRNWKDVSTVESHSV